MKIGDKVRVDYPGEFRHGAVGKIVCDHQSSMPGVEFKEERFGAHDCDGYGKAGHCLWFDRVKLKVIKDITLENK